MADNPFATVGASPTPEPASNPFASVGPSPATEQHVLGKPSAAAGANVPIFGDAKSAADTGKAMGSVSKALDAQGYAVRKALTGKSNTDEQMTEIRHHIPGMDWFYDQFLGNQNPAAGPNLGPLEGPVQGAARGLLHGARGVIDASLQSALDPLTYETAGFGSVVKGLKAAPALERGYLKAVNSTPLSQWMYDQLHWGGAAERSGAASAVGGIAGVRGAAARASATGSMVEQHIVQRFHQIVAPLNDQERVRVGQALNGEADKEYPVLLRDTLTPREQSAYRQLRTLTALDYHIRRSAAEQYALRAYVKPEDRAEVAQALRSGKPPEIPDSQGRVKTPYGEPVERSRATYAKPEDIPNYNELFEDTAKHLRPTNRRLFAQAIWDNNAFAQLPNELQQRVREIQDAMTMKLTPTPVSVTKLPDAPRYTMPHANQDAIDRAGHIQDQYMKVLGVVEKSVPFRKHYMPGFHEGEEGGREAYTYNLTDVHDPRTLHREDLYVKSPEDLERGFTAMAANTNRQVQTRELNTLLGNVLDEPEVKKLFDRFVPATGDQRGLQQQLIDGWMGVVGYPRAGVVSLTPRHGANIWDLAVNTVPPDKLPQFTKEVGELTAKLVTATPRDYRLLTREGRELGAVSGKFMERKPFFQNFPDWGILGPLRGKSVPVLSQWTRFNNKLVWAIDDATKQVYAKIMHQAGEATGLRAGGLAQERLVDYERLSNLQKALRYVAPFGTFRGGIPQAVLGGIARNPARAAFYNRLSGNAYTGDTAQTPEGWQAKFYGPTADVGRMFNYDAQAPYATTPLERSGLGEYARATAAYPLKMAGNVVTPKNWWTYGQGALPGTTSTGQHDPGSLADYVFSGVPELSTATELSGLSHFRPKSSDARQRALLEVYRQVFGLGLTPPPATP